MDHESTLENGKGQAMWRLKSAKESILLIYIEGCDWLKVCESHQHAKQCQICCVSEKIPFPALSFVKNSSEQERGIFPSLPDTSTFGVNSPQMAQKKSQNDPK